MFEINIITILLLFFLAYREASHQKQILNITKLLTTGKIEPNNITLNPFKRILKKDLEKNSTTETDLEEGPREDKYLPLEDVPDDEVRNAFEGNKEIDKEEVEI